MEDEGRYNILRKKAVQNVYILSEGQVIQPPSTVTGQVKGGKNISVLYILNRQYCPLKFQRNVLYIYMDTSVYKLLVSLSYITYLNSSVVTNTSLSPFM
jgi:hypothetical protein